MNLEVYTELLKDIERRLNPLNDLLNSFPKNELGLVEITSEYLESKRKFDLVFDELRTLNKNTPNKIKREYALKRRFKK